MNFFKKIAAFTDIHYGNKNNSHIFNNDCNEFIDWFISNSKDCETCVFLGDFHHHRAELNISTLNHSINAVKKLSQNFDSVYMIVGNHDLYYREKRDLNSFPYASLFDNVRIIEEIFISDEVAFIPWLVGDEWKRVNGISSKYVFGHFEIPHFKLNSYVVMPDNGELNATHLTAPDYVFSGHFHKRQVKGNIHYLGSPFAHNYADTWDDDRGMMTLEWGGEPKYKNFDGPRYRTTSLSKLIDSADEILNDKTYCKATIDLDISYEEASFIRETMMNTYNIREISLVPSKKDAYELEKTTNDNVEIETVDTIVHSSLNAVESNTIDKSILLELYNRL